MPNAIATEWTGRAEFWGSFDEDDLSASSPA